MVFTTVVILVFFPVELVRTEPHPKRQQFNAMSRENLRNKILTATELRKEGSTSGCGPGYWGLKTSPIHALVTCGAFVTNLWRSSLRSGRKLTGRFKKHCTEG